jgi:hypothetical protein
MAGKREERLCSVAAKYLRPPDRRSISWEGVILITRWKRVWESGDAPVARLERLHPRLLIALVRETAEAARPLPQRI